MTATVVGEDAAERPQKVNEREGEVVVVVVGDEIEICEEKRDSRQGPESQAKLKLREVALLVPTLALLLDSMKLWGIGCCRTVKRRWAERRAAGRQGEMSRNTELGGGGGEENGNRIPGPEQQQTDMEIKIATQTASIYLIRVAGNWTPGNKPPVDSPTKSTPSQPHVLSCPVLFIINPKGENAVTPALHYIHS